MLFQRAAVTRSAWLAVALTPILSACQPDDATRTAPEQGKFAAITPDETIRLTGTEPFWSGAIAGDKLTYTTPETPGGSVIVVRRFAGNGGLGYSGTLTGRNLDLAITPGACSDGMSDRSYPFTVTLRLDDQQRQGCAWTDRQPFSGPRSP